RSMVEASPIPAEAFLTTSGGFAIAIKGTFDRKERGEQTMQLLKARRLIPEGSMLTFANT
ncbi:hypothetical protein WDZ92_50480, partial [Nostoc sp. NIES-2111]